MRRVAWAAALILAGCGEKAAPPPSAPAATSSRTIEAARGKKPEPAKEQVDSAEAIAQALLNEAGKTDAKRSDLVLAAYQAVFARHPHTKAGRRAAATCVELEGNVMEAMDREFAPARAAAESLAKEGKFAAAVESLGAYSESAVKEPLKRRAAALAARIENDARRAYVEAVRAAKRAVEAGALDEADRLLKSASEPSIADVRGAAEGDLSLLDRHRRVREAKRSIEAEEASRKAFGDRTATLLKRVRERAYAEVLTELDAAIADPAFEACRERLIADRAAVAAAQSFWEAIQKSLKARLNQEIVLKTSDGKSTRGVLKRLHDSGLAVRLDPAVEINLDALHPDQLLLLGINRDGLPEDAGASYAAAAMWFFLEGRTDLSRLELATAEELKADIAILETSWRRGLFRSIIDK